MIGLLLIGLLRGGYSACVVIKNKDNKRLTFDGDLTGQDDDDVKRIDDEDEDNIFFN